MSKRELTTVALELIAAKRRIENPENWWDGTKGGCARHQNCAVTASMESIATMESIAWAAKPLEALSQSAFALFGLGVTKVNDVLGHAAVMRMYDHAISTEIQKANT